MKRLDYEGFDLISNYEKTRNIQFFERPLSSTKIDEAYAPFFGLKYDSSFLNFNSEMKAPHPAMSHNTLTWSYPISLLGFLFKRPLNPA